MRKLIFLLFILFCITQCKPDDDCSDCTDPTLPPPTDTIFLNQNLKNFYFFGEGSWWVYKRTDTNAVVYDTSRLVRSVQQFQYSRLTAPFAVENSEVGIEHNYYKPTSSIAASPFLTRGVRPSSFDGNAIDMGSNGKLLPSLRNFLAYPFDSTIFQSKGFGKSILLDIKTYNFNNIQFDSTVHLFYGKPEYRSEIWISKDVGLTKYFNVEDSTAWEIVNYEIKL